MTRVVCTSDFHWLEPPVVPECDLLVIAGDVLDGDLVRFEDWLRSVPAGEVVGVAGNRDHVAKTDPKRIYKLPWTYLENEAAVVAGIKVFGSPMSMPFGAWDFMAPETELEKVWATIPEDTEILVTHGPADGILDLTRTGKRTGSRTLRERLLRLPSLRLFVFGHIHESYGKTHLLVAGMGSRARYLTCVNASWVDERYRPGNPPVVIDWKEKA